MDLIKYLAKHHEHFESLKILGTFEKEFLSSNERMEVWNFYEIDLPFMTGYDEDW